MRASAGWMRVGLLGLLACRDAAAPRRTLRVVVPGPAVGLTPRDGESITAMIPVKMLFETLTETDSLGRAQPGLAARWSSPDGVTWTFVLRNGARFHDGRPVRAQDVVRAWNAALRWRENGSESPALLRHIRGADEVAARRESAARGLIAVDDTTLQVVLTAPRVLFPADVGQAQLAVPADTVMPGMRVGSGPWRLVSGQAGDSVMRFARFDQFPRASTTLDTVELLTASTDPDSIVARLDRGADCAPLLVTTPHGNVQARRDRVVVFGRPVLRRRLLLNFDTPALRDVRVRRALQLALDLPALARASGVPAPTFSTSVVPPWLVPDLENSPPVYDARAAERLLAEAGYSRRTPLVLHLPDVWARRDATSLQAVAAYWRAIGVKIEYDRQGAYASPITRGIADLEVYREGTFSPDPLAYLTTISNAQPYGLSIPMARWRTPMVDSLHAIIQQANDSTRSAAAVRRMIQLARDSVPTIVLWFTPPMQVALPGVTGCADGLGNQPFLRARLTAERVR